MEINNKYDIIRILESLPNDIELWIEDEFGRKYDLYELEIDEKYNRIIFK